MTMITEQKFETNNYQSCIALHKKERSKKTVARQSKKQYDNC